MRGSEKEPVKKTDEEEETKKKAPIGNLSKDTLTSKS